MSLSKHVLGHKSEIIANCKVCNETINAYLSYGALACPSCRVFFRRQTSKGQRSLGFCYSNGTCEITKETRTYCQFCRYHKCLKIGMDPERIRKTKIRGSEPVIRFEQKYIQKHTNEAIALAVQTLEAPKAIYRPFLQVTNLGSNGPSFMPFTLEELGFCLDLKQSVRNSWKTHPVPMELFDAMLSKQKMADPQDMTLQKSNEIFTERFVILFNSLDLFKR